MVSALAITYKTNTYCFGFEHDTVVALVSLNETRLMKPICVPMMRMRKVAMFSVVA